MGDTVATAAGQTTAPKGLFSRILGVLTSPRATYADIAARPSWLGMYVVIIVIAAGCGGWLSSTTVGRQAALDEATRMTESFGFRIPDAQYERMRSQIMDASDVRMYVQATLGASIVTILSCLVAAGILIGIFNALLGGDARFKQVFAIVMYSQTVILLKSLFVTPLNYFRESMSNPTSLAAFLPMLDENSLPARMLGAIDLFFLWWLLSLAIGLGVLYRKPTRNIALSLIGVYVVIGVLVAVVLTMIRESVGS